MLPRLTTAKEGIYNTKHTDAMVVTPLKRKADEAIEQI